jgi:hypothetical protein
MLVKLCDTKRLRAIRFCHRYDAMHGEAPTVTQVVSVGIGTPYATKIRSELLRAGTIRPRKYPIAAYDHFKRTGEWP